MTNGRPVVIRGAMKPISTLGKPLKSIDLRTKEESEALVVRGLLESNGIECLETALDAPQDVLPGVGGIVLSVRADQAAEARLMIEEYRRDASQDPRFDDADLSTSDSSANAGPE